jgi:inosine-uridine nucleoside N-ribohydrolase
MKKNFLPKLIIDTDPGHDDALAIILIELSKKFNLMGLTTVAGNSSIQNVTNNARYILDLIGSKTAIYSGSARPLKRKLITANVHGESGLDGATITKREKLNNLAVDKIVQLVKENPSQVTILVLGPETNIARAIKKAPEIVKLIKELVIMGGAIDCPGNKNRVAEFNIFVDPEAAKIVFDSGMKITLVPLDVCNEVILTESDFKKLKGSNIYKPVMTMMKKYIKGIKKFENNKGALVYDALAAYYLINPGSFKTKKRDIRIETEGVLTRGMSVCDKRKWGEQSQNINLIVELEKKKFIKDFVRTLKNN